MAQGFITVFGGSGFLGREITRRLAADGNAVRVAVRHPAWTRSLEGLGGPGKITVVRGDVRDKSSVAEALAGAKAAVNAVSAYVEKGDITFAAIHEQGAATVAREATKAGVERLVHVSGLGADAAATSRYIRARGRGEALVRESFRSAIILRPSALFGPGDALFSTLAGLANTLPVLPLIGGGRTTLQPVYVEDAALAAARALEEPSAPAKTYELGGPRVYTLRELTELVLRLTRRRRALIPIPFLVARVQATLFELLPAPPLTTGQVDLLEVDNVVSGTLPGFADLHIEPRSVEEIVPTYIGRA